MVIRRPLLVACLLGSQLGSARAGEPAPLTKDVPLDLAIAGGATVLWIGSELLIGVIGPSSCRWCDRNADGADSLNGLDRSVREGLVWSSPGTAGTISNVTGFVLVPGLAFGLDALAAAHDGAGSEMWTDWLVIAEATALAADLNQLVKFTVARERPFVHVLPASERPNTPFPDDNNVSFYSGHTSLVFSLAVASGTVASMRGYRLAPVVWGAGLTGAAATAYLRIAADKHYFTDVLTGAAVGSAVGFLVPYVFHHAPGVSATTGAGLTAVRVSWVW